MLFVLTTITPEKLYREFHFQVSDLELGFAILIRITQAGNTILEARLIEQEKTELLPLDFLDQQPYSNPIRQLRKQWELTLDHPLTAYPASKPVPPQWMQYWLSTQQQQAYHLHQMITQMQELCQIAQQTMDESPRKSRWLAHYQRTIDRCQRSVTRLEAQSAANRWL